MKNLAIHHTAVSRSKQKTQLMAVNRYHKEKFNMKSSIGWYVGYNDFIEVSGRQTKTRIWGEETTAIKGHNCDAPVRCDTISVCLAGDFNQELPTDDQVLSLRRYIKHVQEKYPNIDITFHRNLQENRTCPGDLFTQKYLESVILQQTTELDPVDAEKSARIKELEGIIDVLLSLIARLLRG